jgi:hypothetical protein
MGVLRDRMIEEMKLRNSGILNSQVYFKGKRRRF